MKFLSAAKQLIDLDGVIVSMAPGVQRDTIVQVRWSIRERMVGKRMPAGFVQIEIEEAARRAAERAKVAQ